MKPHDQNRLRVSQGEPQNPASKGISLDPLKTPSFNLDFFGVYKQLEEIQRAEDVMGTSGEEALDPVRSKALRMADMAANEIESPNPEEAKDVRTAKAWILSGDAHLDHPEKGIAREAEAIIDDGKVIFERADQPFDLAAFALRRAGFFDRSLQPERAIQSLEWGWEASKEAFYCETDPTKLELGINLQITWARLLSRDLKNFKEIDAHILEAEKLSVKLSESGQATEDLAKVLFEGAKISNYFLNYKAAAGLLESARQICSGIHREAAQTEEPMDRRQKFGKFYLEVLKLRLDNYEQAFDSKLDDKSPIPDESERLRHNFHYKQYAEKAYLLAKKYGLAEESCEIYARLIRKTESCEELSPKIAKWVLSLEATNILLDLCINRGGSPAPRVLDTLLKLADSYDRSANFIRTKDWAELRHLKGSLLILHNNEKNGATILESLIYATQEKGDLLPLVQLGQTFSHYSSFFSRGVIDNEKDQSDVCRNYVISEGRALLELLHYRSHRSLEWLINSLGMGLNDLENSKS